MGVHYALRVPKRVRFHVLRAWQPTLIGIALLFGIGNAFDAIVSLVAYVFLLKKKKINVLGVDEN